MPASDAVVHEVQISHGRGAPSGGLLARVGVVLVVVALLGAGVVAIQGFGSSGGANTPEGAVQDFFAALGNEDFLGAAELVEPAERRTLVDPAIDMVGELRRLRVLADDFDLGSVRGLDLEFAALTYSPEPLGPGVTRVQVDGSMTTSGDVTELDLGSLVLDNVPARDLQLMQDEATSVSTEVLDEVGVVAVERDGRWYVSLWYSVAEAARRSEGAPLPQFGAGPQPVGGDTPEDSVRAFAAAAADLDLGGVIAQLDPEEAAALYDYSTLFTDEADAAAAELRTEDPDFTISVDRLDLRSEVSGDDAVVWIDGVALSITGVDGEVVIDTAAECLLFTSDQWDPSGRCELEKQDLSDVDEWGVDLGLDDVPAPSVRAHRVGERWYLSPTSSLLQPALDLVRVIEADQLARWIDDPDALLEDIPDVIAAAPASAGLAVAGLAGIFALGQAAEQQFMAVDDTLGGGLGAPSLTVDEVEAQMFETDVPPLIELDEPPLIIDELPFEEPPVIVDQPPQVELERPATVVVWVVKAPVMAGAVLSVGDVEPVEVPVALLPAGAVLDLDEIAPLVVTEDLEPGEVLVYSMLGQ